MLSSEHLSLLGQTENVKFPPSNSAMIATHGGLESSQPAGVTSKSNLRPPILLVAWDVALSEHANGHSAFRPCDRISVCRGKAKTKSNMYV
jgi:hypothetical protein